MVKPDKPGFYWVRLEGIAEPTIMRFVSAGEWEAMGTDITSTMYDPNPSENLWGQPVAAILAGPLEPPTGKL